MSPATVTALAITPVKGTRLRPVDRVELTPDGVRENRRFYVVDEQERMVNAKSLGALQTVISRYDDSKRRLELELPDGRLVAGPVRLGPVVRTRFFSRHATARLVLGEWSEALSEHLRRPVHLVEADEQGAVDRGRRGAVSLISKGSLDRLALQGELGPLDPRRFRMLIEIDGVRAHEEDEWVGREVSVGGAVFRARGHVGRCLITSRDPDTGALDLPTLDMLGTYRRELQTTEPLAFGIYGEVVQPGWVRVGNAVAPLDG